MALPKELIEAVKQNKKTIEEKLEDLTSAMAVGIKSLKETIVNLDGNNDDVVDAINKLGKTVKQNSGENKSTSNEIISSLTKHGKLLKIQNDSYEKGRDLEKQYEESAHLLSKEQKEAIKEQIAILKGDKLATEEERREALENAEEIIDSLEESLKQQSKTMRELKEGFESFKGNGGILHTIRAIVVGIPSILAGITVGIANQIGWVLSKFEIFTTLTSKVSSVFGSLIQTISKASGPVLNMLGKIPGLLPFFQKMFTTVSSATGGVATLLGKIPTLLPFIQNMFKFGKTLAKFIGPIGVAIQVIFALVKGIQGAIKGFKQDGIVGMIREGIVGVFNAVIGGLVKMVGSMIGGIFKLLGFQELGEGIKSGFDDFIDGIIETFRGLVNIVGGLFTFNFGMLKKGVAQLLDGILTTLFGIIKGIGGIIFGAFGTVLKVISSIPSKILKMFGFEKLGNAVKDGIMGFFSSFLDYFKGFATLIKGIFTLNPTAIVDGVKQMFSAVLNGLWSAIKAIGSVIIGSYGILAKGAIAIFIKLPLAILKFLADGVAFTLQMIGKALKGIFINLPLMLVALVKDLIVGIFNGIAFVVTKLPSLIVDKVKGLFSSMVEKIGSAFSTAFGFIKKIGAASKAALKAALPGGESPKEAFLRVMNEGKGEEKEEKEESTKVAKEKTEEVDEYVPPAEKTSVALPQHNILGHDADPFGVSAQLIGGQSLAIPEASMMARSDVDFTQDQDVGLASAIIGNQLPMMSSEQLGDTNLNEMNVDKLNVKEITGVPSSVEKEKETLTAVPSVVKSIVASNESIEKIEKIAPAVADTSSTVKEVIDSSDTIGDKLNTDEPAKKRKSVMESFITKLTAGKSFKELISRKKEEPSSNSVSQNGFLESSPVEVKNTPKPMTVEESYKKSGVYMNNLLANRYSDKAYELSDYQYDDEKDELLEADIYAAFEGDTGETMRFKGDYLNDAPVSEDARRQLDKEIMKKYNVSEGDFTEEKRKELAAQIYERMADDQRAEKVENEKKRQAMLFGTDVEEPVALKTEEPKKSGGFLDIVKKVAKTSFGFSPLGLGIKSVKGIANSPIMGGLKSMFGLKGESASEADTVTTETIAGVKKVNDSASKGAYNMLTDEAVSLEIEAIKAKEKLDKFEKSAGSFTSKTEYDALDEEYEVKTYDNAEEQAKYLELKKMVDDKQSAADEFIKNDILKEDQYHSLLEGEDDSDQMFRQMDIESERADYAYDQGIIPDQESPLSSLSVYDFIKSKAKESMLEIKAQAMPKWNPNVNLIEKLPALAGANISATQRETDEIKAQEMGKSIAPVIAPSSVNNSTSSSSSVTIAAPAHIDRTLHAFGSFAPTW